MHELLTVCAALNLEQCIALCQASTLRPVQLGCPKCELVQTAVQAFMNVYTFTWVFIILFIFHYLHCFTVCEISSYHIYLYVFVCFSFSMFEIKM